MKANELFIGAHVEVFGKNRKIKSIVAKDTGVEVSFYGSNTVIVSLDMLRPIPLTPEILEKNFTSTNNMFGFKNYEIGKEFILENRGERFCLSRIFFGHKYSTFYITDIFSIHELQHALKLCGIDKEIVV